MHEGLFAAVIAWPKVPLFQPNGGDGMHCFRGSKPLDASSRGRTSRAHVAWLVPAALASTLLLSAAAVASNFQSFTTQTAFNSFVTGPTYTTVFTGNASAPELIYSSGGSPNFSYAVRAKDGSNTPVFVQLTNTPFGSIGPNDVNPGNQLFFEKQPSSASISAFGGFFSLRDWLASGVRTSGTMTLTAFDGATQVFQGDFTVSGTGSTFFGIAADESNPITRVQLTGAPTAASFWNVNAEQVTVGVVPVPEPSTLALGGCAVLAIVFARRMKPRKARAVIGVSIALLAMHVTSTMADSSFSPRPSDTAVAQVVEGRSLVPPMEPLGPSVADSHSL